MNARTHTESKKKIRTEHPYIVAPQIPCIICLSKCIFVSNRSPHEHLNFNSESSESKSERFSSALLFLTLFTSLACSLRTCCLNLRFVNIFSQNLHFLRIDSCISPLSFFSTLQNKFKPNQERETPTFQRSTRSTLSTLSYDVRVHVSV